MMEDAHYQEKYRVASTRLLGYDYGQSGAYFVTICTKNRQPYFGAIEVPNGHWDAAFLQPSMLGRKALACWEFIPQLAPFIRLDAFVLMPDHLHGVLLFDREAPENSTPIQNYNNRFGSQSLNLASVLRGFKSAVTTYARHNNLEFEWQARFHDRVVRNQHELERIRAYVSSNPTRWQKEYDNGEGLFR
ncbi:hypothetical protein [Hymenobacter sp. GOD-10R]|uniref:hypothetical protein n=1 Tax=Hymenobacter sp. GOD-10R TaxID=3093922 RepID=UPI002D768ECC|nr:hypothetical protein [Hymenobacter sp. GOD-10R]WRQ28221.1 hypothetical protein SD425_24450 [Hymenobacter sp. GOD-10R]